MISKKDSFCGQKPILRYQDVTGVGGVRTPFEKKESVYLVDQVCLEGKGICESGERRMEKTIRRQRNATQGFYLFRNFWEQNLATGCLAHKTFLAPSASKVDGDVSESDWPMTSVTAIFHSILHQRRTRRNQRSFVWYSSRYPPTVDAGSAHSRVMARYIRTTTSRFWQWMHRCTAINKQISAVRILLTF